MQSEGGLYLVKRLIENLVNFIKGFLAPTLKCCAKRQAATALHVKNMEKRGASRHPALVRGHEGQKRDQICETPYSDFRFCAIKAFGGCFRNPVPQNTTSQLAAALKEAQRLDSFEEKDKKKVSPVPDIAKAIVVSISANAKQRLLYDTLK